MAGMDLISSMVETVMTERHATIEEWCEKSLTDPAGRGVLIYTYSNGYLIGLSSTVPWASIHEHHRLGELPRLTANAD